MHHVIMYDAIMTSIIKTIKTARFQLAKERVVRNLSETLIITEITDEDFFNQRIDTHLKYNISNNNGRDIGVYEQMLPELLIPRQGIIYTNKDTYIDMLSNLFVKHYNQFYSIKTITINYLTGYEMYYIKNICSEFIKLYKEKPHLKLEEIRSIIIALWKFKNIL